MNPRLTTLLKQLRVDENFKFLSAILEFINHFDYKMTVYSHKIAEDNTKSSTLHNSDIVSNTDAINNIENFYTTKSGRKVLINQEMSAKIFARYIREEPNFHGFRKGMHTQFISAFERISTYEKNSINNYYTIVNYFIQKDDIKRITYKIIDLMARNTLKNVIKKEKKYDNVRITFLDLALSLGEFLILNYLANFGKSQLYRVITLDLATLNDPSKFYLKVFKASTLRKYLKGANLLVNEKKVYIKDLSQEQKHLLQECAVIFTDKPYVEITALSKKLYIIFRTFCLEMLHKAKYIPAGHETFTPSILQKSLYNKLRLGTVLVENFIEAKLLRYVEEEFTYPFPPKNKKPAIMVETLYPFEYISTLYWINQRPTLVSGTFPLLKVHTGKADSINQATSIQILNSFYTHYEKRYNPQAIDQTVTSKFYFDEYFKTSVDPSKIHLHEYKVHEIADEYFDLKKGIGTQEARQHTNNILKKTTSTMYEEGKDLFTLISELRSRQGMAHNSDISAHINKKSFLHNNTNLETKYVIDQNYLCSFLELLKHYMSLYRSYELIKEIPFDLLKFIEEYYPIFLLYQLPIKTLREFYKEHKDIQELIPVYEALMKVMLDFNMEFEEHSNTLKFLKNFVDIKTDVLSKKGLSDTKIFNIKNFILKIFNKIKSYKLFIRSLIKECLLHASYRYFITESFLDTRGRCYLKGFYLNPQSYPLVKAFVKLYNPIDWEDEDVHAEMYEGIHRILKSDQARKVLSDQAYLFDTYKETSRTLAKEYLLGLLDLKDMTIDAFDNTLEKIRNEEDLFKRSIELLNFLIPRVKKVKKLYVVHSMILKDFHNEGEFSNYYELDATASGLQMTAMLFKDRKLAEECNLVESANKSRQDIYKETSSFFNEKLNSLSLAFIEINSELKKYNVQEITEIIRNLYKQIMSSFDIGKGTISKDNKILVFYQKLKDKINTANVLLKSFSTIQQFNEEFFWIIAHKLPRLKALKLFLTNDVQYQEIQFYMIFNLMGKIEQFRKQVPEIDDWLKSRDFWKKSIMTYGYNATAYGRKQTWVDEILDITRGEKILETKLLANIAENLFSYITNQQLHSSKMLRELGNMISGLVKENVTEENYKFPITMLDVINKNMRIHLHCYKYIKKKCKIRSLYRGRNFNFVVRIPKLLKKEVELPEINVIISPENLALFEKKLIKLEKKYGISRKEDDLPQTKVRSRREKRFIYFNELNYFRLARAFAPNFIHSMDAFLVHYFKECILRINKKMEDPSFLFLNHMTNHDNFALIAPAFLKPLLIECYSYVYKYDYIKTLNAVPNSHLIWEYMNTFIAQKTSKELLPIKVTSTSTKTYVPKPIILSPNFVK